MIDLYSLAQNRFAFRPRSGRAIFQRVAPSCVFWLACCTICLPTTAAPLDPAAAKLLRQYCGDCHGDGADEGGFEIGIDDVDWSQSKTLHDWEDIHEMVSRGIMPPPDADQPNESDRKELLQFADQSLTRHSPIGGTPLRRLNRREYANTIEQLFGIANYDVPHSFPPDNTAHGFDTQASALVVAGSHLEAFNEAATDVADRMFPPPANQFEAKAFAVPASEMVISYSSACLIDGAMRLASSGENIVRNATWPTHFESPAAGVYRLKIHASAINPGTTTPQLTVATMRAADRKDERIVDQIEINRDAETPIELEIELQKGETVALRYLNGPFNYEDADALNAFLIKLFTDDPKLAAAWDHIGEPPRGGSGWQRVKESMAKDLDVSKFLDRPDAIRELAKRVGKDKVATGETLVYKYFEEGPAIAIASMELFGPLKPIRSREEIRSDNLRKRFLGKEFDAENEDSLREFLRRFLSVAFRRPATETEVAGYQALVNSVRADTSAGNEQDRQHAIDRGLHLAIRTALLSPAFLYRGFVAGKLNDHDLATRLSYFLTSAPPTNSLLKAVQSASLGRSDVLRRQAARMLSKEFAREFSTQWLGTDEVDRLMPDMRLTSSFGQRHRKTIRDEVTETFHHILSQNLPVTDFIDPDFVFTDYIVGWDIYAMEQFQPAKKKRVANAKRTQIIKADVPRGGIRGGLLSMPAVMMATANGVDTQPVLRGVWVLENVFGSPPPEPPDAVPALTPDTSAATTVRERLAAHMSDTNCATCHREIDPVGFALESYDPIGRWRDHYPRYVNVDGKAITKEGNCVETDGVLPDGTPINGIQDLKKWLADHPEVFAKCLSEKLLTYATGRKLNYRERKIVAQIVAQERQTNDLRFRDLLLSLIDSEIFRTK